MRARLHSWMRRPDEPTPPLLRRPCLLREFREHFKKTANVTQDVHVDGHSCKQTYAGLAWGVEPAPVQYFGALRLPHSSSGAGPRSCIALKCGNHSAHRASGAPMTR